MNKIDLIIERYRKEILQSEEPFNFSRFICWLYYVVSCLCLGVAIYVIRHNFSLNSQVGIISVIEKMPVIGYIYRSLVISLPSLILKILFIIMVYAVYYLFLVLLHKFIWGRIGSRRYRNRIKEQWQDVVAKRRDGIIALIEEYDLSVSFFYERIKDRLERMPKRPNSFSESVAVTALIFSVLALFWDSFTKTYFSSEYSVEMQAGIMAFIIFEACRLIIARLSRDIRVMEIFNNTAGPSVEIRNWHLYIDILYLIDDIEDEKSS